LADVQDETVQGGVAALPSDEFQRYVQVCSSTDEPGSQTAPAPSTVQTGLFGATSEHARERFPRQGFVADAPGSTNSHKAGSVGVERGAVLCDDALSPRGEGADWAGQFASTVGNADIGTVSEGVGLGASNSDDQTVGGPLNVAPAQASDLYASEGASESDEKHGSIA
jgi:hypothetical protein